MFRIDFRHLPVLAVVLGTLGAGCSPLPVESTAETDPVPSSGDAADDPAIWLHPTDPASSTIFGADKLGGVGVYDLAGNELQYTSYGRPNNIDIRYGFALDGGEVDLLVGSDRAANEITVFEIDGATGLLVPGPVGQIPLAFEPYGICMYESAVDGTLYVFVNAKSGLVEQYALSDAGGRVVQGSLVRSFSVGTQPEGCVADDELGLFYLGEEAVGIWRYGAEPGDGDARVSVDNTGEEGNLTADVEGLSIYHATDGTGYLIAASQGDSTFVVYEREGANDFVTSFEIVQSGDIDPVDSPDGNEVISTGLGEAFPNGLFVTQDDINNGQPQNFKLVAWEDIAKAPMNRLTIDPAWNPRD